MHPGKTAQNKERLFVQHKYNDLLNEPDFSIAVNQKLLSNESFPMKLHRLLDEVEKDGHAHVISWQPHGRAFIIKDTFLFKQIIMPRYFPKANKYSSFQRQFNIYGFKKLARDGPDKGAYYHEAFLRGRPELTSRRMSRKRIKGTGYKACSNPDAEPDFYRDMPFVGVGVGVGVGGGDGFEGNNNNSMSMSEVKVNARARTTTTGLQETLPASSPSSTSALGLAPLELNRNKKNSSASATITSEGDYADSTDTDTDTDSDSIFSRQEMAMSHEEKQMAELIAFAQQMLHENEEN